MRLPAFAFSPSRLTLLGGDLGGGEVLVLRASLSAAVRRLTVDKKAQATNGVPVCA